MLEPGSMELGALESAHYVRRRGSTLFIVFFTAAIVVLIAGMLYVDLIVCSAIPLLVLTWVVLEFLSKRRTELRIYENGFVYRGLFRTRRCRWDEVAEFGHILNDGTVPPSDPSHVHRRRNQFVWIEKHNGEKINLRIDLADIRKIAARLAVKIFGPEHVEYYADDYAAGEMKVTRTVSEVEEWE